MPQPLHIGINALQVRAAKSGVGQYIAGLAEGLLNLEEFQAQGHRLTIFATPENASNYAFPQENYSLIIWGKPGLGLGRRRLNEWAFLPGAIRREGINVWHGPSNFLPLWRIRGCHYIVTLHDVSYWLFPGRVTMTKRLYWRAWTQRTIRMADGFITASEHARRTIHETLGVAPERFRIVPHAAHARFRPDEELHAEADAWWAGDCAAKHRDAMEEGENTARESAGASVLERLGLRPGAFLLSIATLEPGKNLETLVRVFAKIKKEKAGDPRFDGLKLALVGDRGWLLGPLMEEIRGTGLESDIVVTGHLPDEDLPVLLNACGAFGFLSLNEGFGLPPLEALACGAPVIASNTSSLPEVLGEAAVLVDPHDESRAAAELVKSLTDEKARNRLRKGGPARASLYSWERTARETLDCYLSFFNE